MRARRARSIEWCASTAAWYERGKSAGAADYPDHTTRADWIRSRAAEACAGVPRGTRADSRAAWERGYFDGVSESERKDVGLARERLASAEIALRIAKCDLVRAEHALRDAIAASGCAMEVGS